MIVGNNGMWGLEKHPMQMIYGWDMACDLQPGLHYDQVVTALGGAGETVSSPDEIGPALALTWPGAVPCQDLEDAVRRAFAASAVVQRTPYDAIQSFEPVAILARAPFLVLTHLNFAPRDMTSLIAYARANPGRLNCATSSFGTSSHLAPVMLIAKSARA